MARDRRFYTLLAAKAATGASAPVPCADFRNVVVAVTAPLNAALTYKFVGGIGNPPGQDFTAAQSSTNIYDFIEVIDLQDGTAIDGDTGFVLSATSEAVNTRLFEININCLDYFGIVVTAYTSGSLSATATLTNND